VYEHVCILYSGRKHTGMPLPLSTYMPVCMRDFAHECTPTTPTAHARHGLEARALTHGLSWQGTHSSANASCKCLVAKSASTPEAVLCTQADTDNTETHKHTDQRGLSVRTISEGSSKHDDLVADCSHGMPVPCTHLARRHLYPFKGAFLYVGVHVCICMRACKD
jgi:hypothetical protein